MAVWANPPRALELFGSAGVMALGAEDEAGTGFAFGTTVTGPINARWAIDTQTLTARLQDRADYRLRVTLFSPALQYRRGNERAYWFVGGGPGLHAVSSSGANRSSNSTGMNVHGRTGGVFAPTSRLLVRGEFFWANRRAIPHLGAMIPVGVRLGRR